MSSGVADPDLAGPGVLLSFVISGITTLLLSFIIEQLHRVEEQKHDLKISWWFRIAQKCAPAHIRNPITFWTTTLSQVTRGLSDQQLITGPFLLITAYIKYLPAKDWMNLHTAIHASFLSVVSHLVSMQVLIPYLRERKLLAYVCHTIIGFSLLLLPSSSIIFIVNRPTIEDIDFRFLSTCVMIYFSTSRLFGHFFSIIVQIHASPNAVLLHELPQPLVHEPPTSQKRAILWATAYCQLPKNSSHRNLIDTTVIWIWHFNNNRIINIISSLLYILRMTQASPLMLLDPMLKLFLFALVALGFDWYAGRLSGSWGFGQILPMLLLLLPVFTLMGCIVDQVREDRDSGSSNIEGSSPTSRLPEDSIELEARAPPASQRTDGERTTRPETALRVIQKRPTAGDIV